MVCLFVFGFDYFLCLLIVASCLRAVCCYLTLVCSDFNGLLLTVCCCGFLRLGLLVFSTLLNFVLIC